MRVFRVLWPLISLPMMLSFCYIYNVRSGHHGGARHRVV